MIICVCVSVCVCIHSFLQSVTISAWPMWAQKIYRTQPRFTHLDDQNHQIMLKHVQSSFFSGKTSKKSQFLHVACSISTFGGSIPIFPTCSMVFPWFSIVFPWLSQLISPPFATWPARPSVPASPESAPPAPPRRVASSSPALTHAE